MALKPKPPGKNEKEPAPFDLARNIPEPCDRCGYSTITLKNEEKLKSLPLYQSSPHLADSQFEVVIPLGIKGTRCLYFCGHHYRLFETFIAGQGYKVRSWK